jgi:secondary thiamine-phosphate synthase enzyme
MVYGETITVRTQGFSDIRDITESVQQIVTRSGMSQGLANITALGSTASVSTIESEPALIEDMREQLERLVSRSLHSRHSATWGDDNGFSHIRATLMGPGLTLPVTDGAVLLGTWQQIVLIDHDNRPRERQIRVQLLGE